MVIPARDEEGSLPEVLAAIRDAEVIVIDDASTDRTGEIARAAGALVIRHEKAMGCHPSTLEGFAKATGDWVIFLPADGQVPPLVIGPMLEQAKAGGFEIGRAHV